jgi:hypothetical protein
MTYRIFKRTWWADDACTVPGPGPKHHLRGQEFDTIDEAREFCAKHGEMDFGPTRRGRRGMAYEFERA